MVGMRWLRLRSTDPAVRQRALAELGARDAIREAEQIVNAQWISTLETATAENSVTLELLERERVVFVHSERRRARAAERDQRRLGVLIRSAGDSYLGEEVVQSSRRDGSSGTA